MDTAGDVAMVAGGVAMAVEEVMGVRLREVTEPWGLFGGSREWPPHSTYSMRCDGNWLKCGMEARCWQYCG